MKRFATSRKRANFGKRTRRFGRSKKSTGKLRGRVGNASRITTTKAKAIVTDRTFCNFPVTFLTTGELSATGSGLQNNGYGMLPFESGNVQSPTRVDQMVFSPQYNYSTGTSNLDSFRVLPGNSLCQYYQGLTQATPIPSYSDQYEQGLPTGADKWGAFYKNYYCHGSSVEVTMVDPIVSGQLVVLPVCVDDSDNVFDPEGGTSREMANMDGYDIRITDTTAADATGSINVRNLLAFAALPEDQPYAKIKFCSSAGGMDRVKIKHKMTTRKLYDCPKINEDNLNRGYLLPVPVVNNSNAVTNNYYLDPRARQWVWYIAFFPTVPYHTSGTQIVNMEIKVTYFCELNNRVQLDFAL